MLILWARRSAVWKADSAHRTRRPGLVHHHHHQGLQWAGDEGADAVQQILPIKKTTPRRSSAPRRCLNDGLRAAEDGLPGTGLVASLHCTVASYAWERAGSRSGSTPTGWARFHSPQRQHRAPFRRTGGPITVERRSGRSLQLGASVRSGSRSPVQYCCCRRLPNAELLQRRFVPRVEGGRTRMTRRVLRSLPESRHFVPHVDAAGWSWWAPLGSYGRLTITPVAMSTFGPYLSPARVRSRRIIELGSTVDPSRRVWRSPSFWLGETFQRSQRCGLVHVHTQFFDSGRNSSSEVEVHLGDKPGSTTHRGNSFTTAPPSHDTHRSSKR